MNMHRWSSMVVIAALPCCVAGSKAAETSAQAILLQPASAFSMIGDERARSVALFTEAAKVIQR